MWSIRWPKTPLRAQLISVDELEVRVDNAPTLQFLQGKVEHIRVAGRGIVPVENLRIAAFEVETDTVDFDFERLRRGEVKLDAPFQAGIRLEMSEADINQFLASPAVGERLNNLRFNLFSERRSRQAQRYRLQNPQVHLIGNNRLQIQVDITDVVSAEDLAVVVETGFLIAGGSRLQLVNPTVTVDDSPAPSQLVQQIIEGINDGFNLQTLEPSGVTTRILELTVGESAVNLALFARVEPAAIEGD
ncbi:MAG: DUF2993 domain-containing protein [Leptolyngbyaceae cyanobacterium SM1_1_3]|nr:DUF2993 domain-containing protein [Leptolyngbyaceae cyanobacterium SM1_1_3]